MTPPSRKSDEPGNAVSAAPSRPPVHDSATATVRCDARNASPSVRTSGKASARLGTACSLIALDDKPAIPPEVVEATRHCRNDGQDREAEGDRLEHRVWRGEHEQRDHDVLRDGL